MAREWVSRRLSRRAAQLEAVRQRDDANAPLLFYSACESVIRSLIRGRGPDLSGRRGSRVWTIHWYGGVRWRSAASCHCLPCDSRRGGPVRNCPATVSYTLEYQRLRATPLRHDAGLDLALLEVHGYRPPFTFVLAGDREIANNIPALSYEYGTTENIAGVDHLAPATRMGNVTRVIDLSDRFGPAGRQALELSFPALRGASGAPVFSSVNTHLWGIVIANYEYHLLPAQIETVRTSTGDVAAETRYLLPQAIAVNAKHLRSLLTSQ